MVNYNPNSSTFLEELRQKQLQEQLNQVAAQNAYNTAYGGMLQNMPALTMGLPDTSIGTTPPSNFIGSSTEFLDSSKLPTFKKSPSLSPYAAQYAADEGVRAEAAKRIASSTKSNYASAGTNAPNTAASAAGKSKGRFFKKGGTFDGESGKLKNFYNKASSPELDWNKQSGVQAYGKNIGKFVNWANAIYQGHNLAEGFQENADARDKGAELVSDIISSSYNSPTIQYDLTPDQLNLLRTLRRDGYEDDSIDVSNVDVLGALGDAAMGGLTGIAGGIPGMVIGALGGGLNSVVDDFGNAKNITNSELESLYNAIVASEQQNNALKKQRAYASLGMY